MKKITKKTLIDACTTILEEYKNGIHIAYKDICPLCLIYNISKNNCTTCPMMIFNNNELLEIVGNACIQRLCRGDHSDSLDRNETNKVIEFYTQTIKWLKTLSIVQINDMNTFKHLIEIDKQTYNKFKN